MHQSILVTGGLGYLGGRLLSDLRDAGWGKLALTTRRAQGDITQPAWTAEPLKPP